MQRGLVGVALALMGVPSLASATSVVPDEPEPFAPSVIIDATSAQDLSVIATADGRVHLVWRGVDETDAEVIFHTEADGTGAWGPPRQIVSGFVFLSGPQPVQGPAGLCILFRGATNMRDPGTLALYETCETEGGWPEPTAVFRFAAITDGATPLYVDGRLVVLIR
jgi:hypothetical protein